MNYEVKMLDNVTPVELLEVALEALSAVAVIAMSEKEIWEAEYTPISCSIARTASSYCKAWHATKNNIGREFIVVYNVLNEPFPQHETLVIMPSIEAAVNFGSKFQVYNQDLRLPAGFWVNKK